MSIIENRYSLKKAKDTALMELHDGFTVKIDKCYNEYNYIKWRISY